MNARERFLACMHYEKTDRPVLWEWGPWRATLRRWQEEGGFDGVAPEYAECDRREGAGVNFGFVPAFARKVIEDDGRTTVYINEKGQTLKEMHRGEESMPEFLDYPVKTRDDWERLKERMDPLEPSRYPEDWDDRVKRWSTDRAAPLDIGGGRDGGLFRNLLDSRLVGDLVAGMDFLDKFGLGDLGQNDLLAEPARLADQNARGLGHALDHQGGRHDRKSLPVIVEVLLGQRDVLDRLGPLSGLKDRKPINPDPSHALLRLFRLLGLFGCIDF